MGISGCGVRMMYNSVRMVSIRMVLGEIVGVSFPSPTD